MCDWGVSYSRRIVDDELDELFGYVPALVLDGAKAVGNTTTGKHRTREMVQLDSTSTQVPIEAEPSQILRRSKPLLIDEWQKIPEVWDVARRAVDANSSGGHFLLAGSASPRGKRHNILGLGG